MLFREGQGRRQVRLWYPIRLLSLVVYHQPKPFSERNGRREQVVENLREVLVRSLQVLNDTLIEL